MPHLAMSAVSFPGRTVPFAKVDEGSALQGGSVLPVTVIIAAKNEEQNLPTCLESVRIFDEVVVVDSQSTDETVHIARSLGADVVQFFYRGGWPKKRQWAMENLSLRHEWVLLLDADEAVSPELLVEIRHAIRNPEFNGCYIGLEMIFLGKRLRHCGASFYKLALFRRGFGAFECRTPDQDASMCDMEVHEHVVVKGKTCRLKAKILHRNVDTLDRYIQKHNGYSNWEARVWNDQRDGQEKFAEEMLLGSQARRRRWLKHHFLHWPGSPGILFAYRYILRAGFLDGIPGFIYCAFQAIQLFHVKAKLYEKRVSSGLSDPATETDPNCEEGPHVRN